MAYYPIFLEMAGRRCVVIGGGAVGERKVEGLLRAGATVKVISPALTKKLQAWSREKKIDYVAREYRAGDLEGCDLAFIAADEGKVGEAVLREGRERRVWVNAADDPDHCDFILPSVVRRGELVVAVSTGGSSPAVSRAVREELEDYFTEDYALLSDLAAEARRELKRRSKNPGPDAWRRALNSELRGLIKAGNRDRAKAYLLRCLEVER